MKSETQIYDMAKTFWGRNPRLFNLLASIGILEEKGETEALDKISEEIQEMAEEAISGGVFEIDMAKNGKYFFRLKASNGEILCRSQMYASLSGVRNGIASLKKHSKTDEIKKIYE